LLDYKYKNLILSIDFLDWWYLCLSRNTQDNVGFYLTLKFTIILSLIQEKRRSISSYSWSWNSSRYLRT